MAMQKQVAYPVGLGADDSVQFSIVAVGAVTSRIMGVRVQDVARQIWFNWDNGVWSTPTPSCVPGAGNLYIAFAAENIGEIGGNITLTLEKMELDQYGYPYYTILAQKTVYVDPDTPVGLEWTGDMPPHPLFITCYSDP